MSLIRVLGIGSPFGDDHLGFQVLELLQASSHLSSYIPAYLELMYCDRPNMRLLEYMQKADTVFLIDAVQTGATIGSIHTFTDEAIETLPNPLSSHGLGVAEAIRMGRALNMLPKHVVLYGIEIGSVQCVFTLEKPIKKAVRQLALQIEGVLRAELALFLFS